MCVRRETGLSETPETSHETHWLSPNPNDPTTAQQDRSSRTRSVPNPINPRHRPTGGCRGQGLDLGITPRRSRPHVGRDATLSTDWSYAVVDARPALPIGCVQVVRTRRGPCDHRVTRVALTCGFASCIGF